MPNKTIYLSKELFEQCKTINSSDIISKLLRDYFLSKKSKTELLSEVEKIKEEKNDILRDLEEKESKIILEVKKVETSEEDEERRHELEQHKLADKISNCVNNCKDIFDVEISPEEAEEYIKGKWNNIKEYLIEKNKL